MSGVWYVVTKYNLPVSITIIVLKSLIESFLCLHWTLNMRICDMHVRSCLDHPCIMDGRPLGRVRASILSNASICASNWTLQGQRLAAAAA